VGKELTILQQRFADILFSMKEPNQTQAYIQAGYKARGNSAKVEACRTLKKPNVKAYLKKLRNAVTKRTEIDGAKVVTELGKVAFTNIKDYINVDEEGNIHFIPFDQIDEEKLAAIESIKVRVNVTTNKKEDKEYTTATQEFKLHSKLNALEQIGRHFGIYDKDNQQRMKPFVLIFNHKKETKRVKCKQS
jgi:phage terminase small subunit